MLKFKNKQSLSYIIGIVLPAVIGIFMNLYELIFHPLSKHTLVITTILILYMFFNIGLREIIVRKKKDGYFFLIFAVILSIRVIIKYFY